MSIIRSLTLLLIALTMISPVAAQDQEDPGKELLANLAEARPAQVEDAINAIATSGDVRARSWLDAYGNNRLSQIKDSGEIVIVLTPKT